MNIIYDMANHDLFYDNLKIMETLKSNYYNLIFMDIPCIIKPYDNLQTFEYNDYPHEQQHYADFICKCIENAHRLLKKDGILVVFIKSPYIFHLDFSLILSQFFPSITTVSHSYTRTTRNEPNTIFFCSKYKHFQFPTIMEHPPAHTYKHMDNQGLYRTTPAFCLGNNDPKYRYNWKGHCLHKDFSWIYTKNEMDELYHKGYIHFDHLGVSIKIYQKDELIPASPLWVSDFYNYIISTRSCDPGSIKKVLSTYCLASDKVLFPFEVCDFFSVIADELNLSWTSIRQYNHLTYKSQTLSPIITSEYRLIDKLPISTTSYNYRTDIITSCDAINELKADVKNLTTPLIDLDEYDSTYDIPYINPVATGKNLNRLRTANSLSMKDVQDLYGDKISLTSLYNWEAGKHLPKTNKLAKLAAIYKVPSIDYLLVITKPKDIDGL